MGFSDVLDMDFLLKHIVRNVVDGEAEHALPTDNLIFQGFVAGEVSRRVLVDRADQAFPDLGDFLGAALVGMNADLGFVHQAVANNLPDEGDQAVDSHHRLVQRNTLGLDGCVPLVAYGELGIVLAGVLVVLVVRAAFIVAGPHFAQELIRVSIARRRSDLVFGSGRSGINP